MLTEIHLKHYFSLCFLYQLHYIRYLNRFLFYWLPRRNPQTGLVCKSAVKMQNYIKLDLRGHLTSAGSFEGTGLKLFCFSKANFKILTFFFNLCWCLSLIVVT